MYVACSTLCFTRLSLDDALKTIRDLRFAKVDLAIHSEGSHLRPADIAADPVKVSQRLRASNLQFAAFYLDLGTVTGTVAETQLRAVCRLARLLAVPVITVPAAAAGSDVSTELTRLTAMVKIATTEGVILCVETDAKAITGDVAATVALCRRITDLGVTLDPTHYLCRDDGPVDFDALYPFVRHVRLRDSGTTPEQFQVRVGQGHIEYGRIISQLDRHRYDRALTVDVRDVPDNPFPVDPEVRKLKYLLESLV
jgi:sugar phosphate isomerase/epimerase